MQEWKRQEIKIKEFLAKQHQKYGGMKLAEQAVPSYMHWFPLMSYTFWRRIKKAVLAASSNRDIGNVLDFGAGTGISLPFLSRVSKSDKNCLWAFEPEDYARQIIRELSSEFALTEVKVLESFDEVKKIPPGSIDTILALDVLEHIEDLEATVLALKKLVNKNSVIIVSSPTESWLYKLTRQLFGSEEYKQHYHFSNAEHVEAVLAKFFDVKLIERMYPPFVYFRLVECRWPADLES